MAKSKVRAASRITWNLMAAGGPCASIWGARSPLPTPPAPQNHTAHNQTAKAHKNGIKTPLRQRYSSTTG